MFLHTIYQIIVLKLLNYCENLVLTPKKSVICNDQKCWVENTCHIKLTGLHHELIEDRVWNPIKNEYNLDCAYLDINGYYIGCIRNFIRPSSCPTKKYKN